MVKRVLVMAGHTASGNTGCGAIGLINESNETRKVAPKVVEYLKKMGVNATYIKLDKATSSSYLYDQVKLANSKGTFDCVVQIHFNSGAKDKKGNGKNTGTETFYRTSKGKVFSDRVNKKLSTIFKDRGSRDDKPNLYWLKNTNCPAILTEVCFVDDKDDVDLYKKNFDKICKLIAEGIANKTVPTASTSANKNTNTNTNKNTNTSTNNSKKKYANGDYNRKAKTTENLNLRTGRGTKHKIIKTIPKGTEFTVNYCLDNWFSTYDFGKDVGFVCGDYITLL